MLLYNRLSFWEFPQGLHKMTEKTEIWSWGMRCLNNGIMLATRFMWCDIHLKKKYNDGYMIWYDDDDDDDDEPCTKLAVVDLPIVSDICWGFGWNHQTSSNSHSSCSKILRWYGFNGLITCNYSLSWMVHKKKSCLNGWRLVVPPWLGTPPCIDMV